MISVITVCFNAAEELRRTFQSVTTQDSGDMEYIIIDGNSSDSSKNFIAANSEKITKWISEPDRGIYDAMNKGVGMASGDWIVFMNAGDTFATRDTVSRLNEAVADLPEDVDVVYGDVIRPGRNGEDVIKKAEDAHNSHRMFFCHQSALTRRDALLRHPFDISHRYSADFKFFKQILHEGRAFRRVDFPVARFDLGGISNRRRSEGLADNMRVIRETDGTVRGLGHLLRLFPTWLIARVRGK